MFNNKLFTLRKNRFCGTVFVRTKQKKDIQYGRSMIEILGVLAITGILSIGGIWGYQFSINKHLANVLTHEASKRAVDVMSQISLGNTPALSHFSENNFRGVEFDTLVHHEGLDKQFGIKASGVKKEICQNILSNIANQGILVRLSSPTNPQNAITECDSTDVLFVYNNDLTLRRDTQATDSFENPDNPGTSAPPTEDPPTEEEPAPEDEPECKQPIVKINNCDGSVSDCCPDHDSCTQPTECCHSDSDCTGMYQVCKNNECVCPEVYFQNKNGNCTHCGNTAAKETSKSECDKCAPHGYPRYMDGNFCTLPENCPDGYFKGIKNKNTICISCTDPNSYKAASTDCDRCNTDSPLREMKGEYCTLKECAKGYFKDSDGICRSCSVTGSYKASSQECHKCDDEDIPRYFKDSDHCSLCPTGQFYQTDYMVCRDCSSSSHFVSTQEACSACDNTDYPRHIINGRCYLLNCKNGYFKKSDEICNECSDRYGRTPYNNDANECAKCDNTDYPRQMVGDKCSLKSCQTGYFLKSNGDCEDCSNQTPQTPFNAAECSKCDNTDYPREMFGTKCALVTTCNSGEFKTSSGTCVSCSDTNRQTAYSNDECTQCNQTETLRKIVNGYCDPVCPNGWFQNKNGNCTLCANTNAKETSQTECDKCNDTPFRRQMSGNKCTLNNCPSGYFKGKEDSICRSCSDTTSYQAVSSECAKCSSRHMDGNYCVL